MLLNEVPADHDGVNVGYAGMQDDRRYRIRGSPHVDVSLAEKYQVSLLARCQGPDLTIEPGALSRLDRHVL